MSSRKSRGWGAEAPVYTLDVDALATCAERKPIALSVDDALDLYEARAIDAEQCARALREAGLSKAEIVRLAGCWPGDGAAGAARREG